MLLARWLAVDQNGHTMSTCALERRGNHGGAWDVSVRKFNKTVHPFNFENLKSSDFERLVFAFLCRRWAWKALDWYGQLGADGGRDIIGVREDEWGRDEAVVVAWANWQRLTAEKARSDLDDLLSDVGKDPVAIRKQVRLLLPKLEEQVDPNVVRQVQ